MEMLNSPSVSNHIPQWNNSFCHHVQLITSEWQNSELGGFSISYVHLRLNRQMTNLIFQSSTDYSFFTVISSSSPLNGRALSLVTPN